MSDELTPPFEEPLGSSPDEFDEVLDRAAEIDSFDLNNWVEGEDVLLGFTGMLKIIEEDGTLIAFHVAMGLNEFEALGLHYKAIDKIKQTSEMDTYWTDDD